MQQKFHQVVYQIYPRSFQDSNGDGIGDLRGILSRLNYLHYLGVDTLWLSPIYPSHQHDYGYDIDDYTAIDATMGTMEDFKELITQANRLGIKIIMDFVANHTSVYHPWYQAALADPESPYRDFYFFRDRPNNWMSAFGGSAWQKVEGHDDYVLTMFSPWQADLNWENPAVRQHIYEAMRFWLDLGVAGFRLDVINIIAKQPGLPDYHPEKKGLQFPETFICSLPASHEYIQEMHREVLNGCFSVGEGMLVTLDETKRYTGKAAGELDMMFQFDLSLIGCGPLGKFDFRKLYHWSIRDFKAIIRKWQNALETNDFWMGNYLSNHDFPRQVSRFGNDTTYREASAKGLALLNFMLKGTPFIYQGEEIGMTNCRFTREEWRDYEAIHDYEVLQSMMHVPAFMAEKIINAMTRDHARTPMQWEPEPDGGFSDHEPWIKVNENTKDINVRGDLLNKDSIFHFYRRLIAIYHQYPMLAQGHTQELLVSNKRVISYRRFDETSSLVAFINLDSREEIINVPQPIRDGMVLLDNYPQVMQGEQLVLRPYECVLYRLS